MLQILEPGAYQYTLVYDTQIVIPSGSTTVNYENSATVTLFGGEFTKKEQEHTLADINIAAKRYSVQIVKTEGNSGTNAPLADAEFGLFAANGELVINGKTDDNGELTFQSNLTAGVILREHVLYYIQEIQAPQGYATDTTRYWFCFCNSKESTCATCTSLMAGQNAFRIPYEDIGMVRVVNYLGNYRLPATGGPGIYPYLLCGAVLITAPIVCGYLLKRRRGGWKTVNLAFLRRENIPDIASDNLSNREKRKEAKP